MNRMKYYEADKNFRYSRNEGINREGIPAHEQKDSTLDIVQ